MGSVGVLAITDCTHMVFATLTIPLMADSLSVRCSMS